MSDISSSAYKSGNVLALLSTLYTSGFAMASPNQPMLTGRTMHTLYALSFLVYSINASCDWIHVYFTLRGAVASFPLENWLVIALVSTAVCGSILNMLLLVLCVENAFAHRLDITPYRSGFAIILEAIVEWMQAFNNFRVVFLVMLLHDTPMTFFNFFLIASCRCSGPQVVPWSLLISSLSTCLSLLWRIIMLYFGYRRMICPVKKTKETPGVARWPTPMEHLKQLTSTYDGGRLDEYDEFWPVRLSRLKIYGRDFPEDDPETKKMKKRDAEQNYCIPLERRPNLCHNKFADKTFFVAGKLMRMLVTCTKAAACGTMSFFLYLSIVLSCGVPCCYHYICRKNSFHHRHKCSRSCVRYSSFVYHYFILIYSLVSTMCLLLMNIVLITSVHVIGGNQIPPEISRVCIVINKESKLISAAILPEPLWNSGNQSVVCKPMWENGGLGLGIHRKEAGPWQMRSVISHNQMLAVSTQIILNNTDRDNPFLTLLHDHAVLTLNGPEFFSCSRNKESNWSFVPDESPLPWPYFSGCRKNWFYQEARLIDCNLELSTTTRLFYEQIQNTSSSTSRKPISSKRKPFYSQKRPQRRRRHEKVATSASTKF